MRTSTSSKHQSETIEKQTTLKEKGQLTVPTDVREILNLQEGDRIAYIVDENKKVEVMKKTSVVAQTAGALKDLKPVLSAEELRIEAERAIAEASISRAEQ